MREYEKPPEGARRSSSELAQWLEREIEREAMDDADWRESGASKDFIRGYNLALAWTLARLRETGLCRSGCQD